MTRARWRSAAVRLFATAVVAGAVVIAFVPRLLGVGPANVHDPSVLAATITVCDRQYRGDGRIRPYAAIEAEDKLPPVLVDPAPLAPCPGPDAHGLRPCTRDPSIGPCSTVVHVRIGEDAYAQYALVGGP